ncbi:cytochrome C-type biogenesis protein (ccdA), conjectural [Methanosarcina sp. MTP4]|uniref:cytochrome c biogenesis CcdA family protein n=1 Tax=Methanosarcina sp. MTP4 TaxID=1434100 RepID=UPI0006160CF9|nr:cytochrome c biogenesis CcdA family protein [Methanosarcina sp. MTP4]AKB23813.1 cytochrome C-type biogenesis protein (ccdA), conjectural [Methanosarcina sp. MTP4]
MFNEAISPLAAFGAGVLSILSPCILPLLPAVLASSTEKGKLRPLAIVLGLSMTFTLMGVVTSTFGATAQAYIGHLKILAEILIIIMGVAMLLDLSLFNAFARFPLLAGLREGGLISGLLLGLSLGIIWIPCVGPILASILTLVALEGDTLYGALMLFIYSLGFAVPMLLLAYSTHLSSTKLRTISQYDAAFKKGAGIVLILIGLWMIYQNHLVSIF